MGNLILVESTQTKTVEVVEMYRVDDKIRDFIYAMVNAHLTELDHTDQKFVQNYKKLRHITETFNKSNIVSVIDIKNAIRLLDRRISHCKNSLKEGEWTSEILDYPQDRYGLLESPTTEIKTKKENLRTLIRKTYNQYTMDCMLYVRQLLSDAIMLITPEFE